MADLRTSFVMYNDYVRYFDMLTIRERGVLITLILDYVNKRETDSTLKLSGKVEMAFEFIRTCIERDSVKYDEVCRKRSDAVKSRYHPKSQPQSEEKSYNVQEIEERSLELYRNL